MAVDFRPDRSGLAALVRHVDATVIPRLCDAIADNAQRYAPVLTGDLKASIRTEYAGGDTGYVVAGDNGDVDYAGYQEFGTSKMQAQPYLRPSAYTVRDL